MSDFYEEYIDDEVYDDTDYHASWRDQAPCFIKAQEMPEMANAWTSAKDPFHEAAKDICAKCPMKLECLTAAVEEPETWGLRGGFFFHMGGLYTDREIKKARVEFGVTPIKVRRNRRLDLDD